MTKYIVFSIRANNKYPLNTGGRDLCLYRNYKFSTKKNNVFNQNTANNYSNTVETIVYKSYKI